MRPGPFTEKVVVITGASRGIGAELAYQLSEQGARLALAARDISRLETVAGQCQARGGEAICIPTDVSEAILCQDLIEGAVKHFGRLDMLVNNAGITMWAKFEEVQDLTIYEKIMRVNYLGSVFCTYYALPYLKQSRGRLVAVSSLTGKAGVPTRSGYAASKHAMVGFFDSLRMSWHLTPSP
jgi:NAD(P)-dependent dehydrogenase (short-subunit alcohol dehydrogenase family)